MKIPHSLLIAIILFFAQCSQPKTDEPSTNITTNQTSKDSTNTKNPILFRFAFVGCNRIDKDDKQDDNTDESTANLPQLQRTYQEVSALSPKPKYFFFLGDMVIGQSKKKKHLEKELRMWAYHYYDTDFSPISTSGIEMIAVPGNHEMHYKGDKKNKDKAYPFVDAMEIWLKYMSPFMPNAPVNRVTGKYSYDNLATYSFQHQNTHFIVMNTDTYNDEKQIGQIPLNWVKEDIAKARQNPAIEHIFVLGHKPVYVEGKLTIRDKGIDSDLAKPLWSQLEDNQVEAMLSAHYHQYDKSQPTPKKTYQIIAGNGGSKYGGEPNKQEQFFGYTMIDVMRDGTVKLTSMGRNVSDKDYLKTLSPSVETTVKDEMNISWGTTLSE